MALNNNITLPGITFVCLIVAHYNSRTYASCLVFFIDCTVVGMDAQTEVVPSTQITPAGEKNCLLLLLQAAVETSYHM